MRSGHRFHRTSLLTDTFSFGTAHVGVSLERNGYLDGRISRLGDNRRTMLVGGFGGVSVLGNP